MTRNRDAAEYLCNKCGVEMRFRERKLIIAEVADAQNPEWLDVHVCYDCKPVVVDFINSPPRQMPKRARDGKFIAKNKAISPKSYYQDLIKRSDGTGTQKK